MLAKDVEILDIEPLQYERLMGLLPAAGGRKQGLILIYSENRLVHAVHTRRGPVEDVKFRGPEHLKELAGEYGVDYVLCLERNVLRRITADAQSRVVFDDPLSVQALAVYQAVRKESGSGLHIHPDVFSRFPATPSRAARLARRLFMHNSLVIAVVFDDGGDVWSSLIVEVRGGEISLITTTDFLEPVEHEAGESEEERASRLVRRLEEKRRRPTVGLFCDRAVLAHIMSHPKPLHTLVRLSRLGWIRLQPFPVKFRLALRLAGVLGL